jgi:predicted small lipoprotein YifL
VAQGNNRMVTAGLVLVLVAAASLSACGRKGPLEAPPGAAVAGDAAATQADPNAIPRPDKPFILDPLLD